MSSSVLHTHTLVVEGETEESVYKKMLKKLEDVENKRTQEELIKNNWYYLDPEGKK